MALLRQRPTDLVSLQRQMNDAFDRFLDFGNEDAQADEGGWLPAVNVSETTDNLVIEAELPGMESKDIDISLLGDVLTIKGEKRHESEDKGQHWHRVERSHGRFTRSFRLPVAIAADKVAADYKNGVLRVTLPKSEHSKTRAVKVKLA